MAHVKADRVQQTTQSTGTGALTFDGPVPTRMRAFVSVMNDGDTCWVLIENQSAGEWEISLATYNAGTITRSFVAGSASTTGGLVPFSGGVKTVSLLPPASKSVVMNNNGGAQVEGTMRAGNFVVADEALTAAGTFGFSNTNGPGLVFWGTGAAGAGMLQLNTGGVARWSWTVTGNFLPALAGTYNIGSISLPAGSVYAAYFRAANHLVGDEGAAEAGSFGFSNTNGPGMVAWGSGSAGGGDLEFKTGGASRWKIKAAGDLLPMNIHNVGSASFRVGTYFGVIGAIDTSDAREKSHIRGYTEAEIRVARRLGPKVSFWQLNDSIREKGVEAARIHIGWVFQDVVAAFVAEDLSPFRYGCVGFDELDKIEKYMEMVPRKKMRPVPGFEPAIEMVDGKPVLVQRAIEREEPVGQNHPVLNPDGSPAMVDKGRRSADGTPILESLTHFVPEMEEVEEPRTRIVPDIDDNGERRVRGNVRPTQLLAFVLGALVADLAALGDRVSALEAP